MGFGRFLLIFLGFSILSVWPLNLTLAEREKPDWQSFSPKASALRTELRLREEGNFGDKLTSTSDYVSMLFDKVQMPFKLIFGTTLKALADFSGLSLLVSRDQIEEQIMTQLTESYEVKSIVLDQVRKNQLTHFLRATEVLNENQFYEGIQSHDETNASRRAEIEEEGGLLYLRELDKISLTNIKSKLKNYLDVLKRGSGLPKNQKTINQEITDYLRSIGILKDTQEYDPRLDVYYKKQIDDFDLQRKGKNSLRGRFLKRFQSLAIENHLKPYIKDIAQVGLQCAVERIDKSVLGRAIVSNSIISDTVKCLARELAFISLKVRSPASYSTNYIKQQTDFVLKNLFKCLDAIDDLVDSEKDIEFCRKRFSDEASFRGGRVVFEMILSDILSSGDDPVFSGSPEDQEEFATLMKNSKERYDLCSEYWYWGKRGEKNEAPLAVVGSFHYARQKGQEFHSAKRAQTCALSAVTNGTLSALKFGLQKTLNPLLPADKVSQDVDQYIAMTYACLDNAGVFKNAIVRMTSPIHYTQSTHWHLNARMQSEFNPSKGGFPRILIDGSYAVHRDDKGKVQAYYDYDNLEKIRPERFQYLLKSCVNQVQEVVAKKVVWLSVKQTPAVEDIFRDPVRRDRVATQIRDGAFKRCLDEMKKGGVDKFQPKLCEAFAKLDGSRLAILSKLQESGQKVLKDEDLPSGLSQENGLFLEKVSNELNHCFETTQKAYLRKLVEDPKSLISPKRSCVDHEVQKTAQGQVILRRIEPVLYRRSQHNRFFSGKPLDPPQDEKDAVGCAKQAARTLIEGILERKLDEASDKHALFTQVQQDKIVGEQMREFDRRMLQVVDLKEFGDAIGVFAEDLQMAATEQTMQMIVANQLSYVGDQEDLLATILPTSLRKNYKSAQERVHQAKVSFDKVSEAYEDKLFCGGSPAEVSLAKQRRLQMREAYEAKMQVFEQEQSQLFEAAEARLVLGLARSKIQPTVNEQWQGGSREERQKATNWLIETLAGCLEVDLQGQAITQTKRTKVQKQALRNRCLSELVKNSVRKLAELNFIQEIDPAFDPFLLGREESCPPERPDQEVMRRLQTRRNQLMSHPRPQVDQRVGGINFARMRHVEGYQDIMERCLENIVPAGVKGKKLDAVIFEAEACGEKIKRHLEKYAPMAIISASMEFVFQDKKPYELPSFVPFEKVYRILGPKETHPRPSSDRRIVIGRPDGQSYTAYLADVELMKAEHIDHYQKRVERVRKRLFRPRGLTETLQEYQERIRENERRGQNKTIREEISLNVNQLFTEEFEKIAGIEAKPKAYTKVQYQSVVKDLTRRTTFLSAAMKFFQSVDQTLEEDTFGENEHKFGQDNRAQNLILCLAGIQRRESQGEQNRFQQKDQIKTCIDKLIPHLSSHAKREFVKGLDDLRSCFFRVREDDEVQSAKAYQRRLEHCLFSEIPRFAVSLAKAGLKRKHPGASNREFREKQIQVFEGCLTRYQTQYYTTSGLPEETKSSKLLNDLVEIDRRRQEKKMSLLCVDGLQSAIQSCVEKQILRPTLARIREQAVLASLPTPVQAEGESARARAQKVQAHRKRVKRLKPHLDLLMETLTNLRDSSFIHRDSFKNDTENPVDKISKLGQFLVGADSYKPIEADLELEDGRKVTMIEELALRMRNLMAKYPPATKKEMHEVFARSPLLSAVFKGKIALEIRSTLKEEFSAADEDFKNNSKLMQLFDKWTSPPIFDRMFGLAQSKEETLESIETRLKKLVSLMEKVRSGELTSGRFGNCTLTPQQIRDSELNTHKQFIFAVLRKAVEDLVGGDEEAIDKAKDRIKTSIVSVLVDDVSVKGFVGEILTTIVEEEEPISGLWKSTVNEPWAQEARRIMARDLILPAAKGEIRDEQVKAKADEVKSYILWAIGKRKTKDAGQLIIDSFESWQRMHQLSDPMPLFPLGR